MFCKDPDNNLFNGVDPELASKYKAMLQHQPASGWDEKIEYAAWTKLPSTYLVCEKDNVVLLDWQLQMAKGAGCELIRCDAGHMVMLSSPQTVVNVIKSVAERC